MLRPTKGDKGDPTLVPIPTYDDPIFDWDGQSSTSIDTPLTLLDSPLELIK